MEPQHTQKSKKTTPNSCKHQESPGGMQFTAKQLKLKNPVLPALMCRLAAHACPSGGFLTDSQNFAEASWFNRDQSYNSIHIITGHYARIKNIKNNSPYLNFPLQIEILTLLAHLPPFAKRKHFNSSLPGLFHEPDSPLLTLWTVCTLPRWIFPPFSLLSQA